MSERSVFRRTENLSSHRNVQNNYSIKDLASAKCDNIDEILKNPIKCGYLLAFCESEFSAENIHYLIEIDRFRDSLNVDKNAWNKDLDYSQLDALLNQENNDLTEDDIKQLIQTDELYVGKESLWPSKKVHFESAYQGVIKIWNEFLSPNAPKQICMPSKVLINTKKRLENLHLYGGSVFDETSLDPIKTLKKDALPRFLASPYYEKLIKRIRSLDPLPTAITLNLPLPGKFLTSFWDEKDITTEQLLAISMSDMLHDRLLYQNFLAYCKSVIADENILCGRAISIFKCHYKYFDRCPLPAEDAAWTVFRYFVAPGSVYEVSLSYRRRKELMLAMADPKKDMFDCVEGSTHAMLRVLYGNFGATKQFEGLYKLVLNEKHMREREERKNKKQKSLFPTLQLNNRGKQHSGNRASVTRPLAAMMNVPTRLIANVFLPHHHKKDGKEYKLDN